MKRVCYFCAKYMDEKDDNRQEGVFHSLCDECACRLRLDEKLPELLWAIAALRQKNGGQELSSLQLEPLPSTSLCGSPSHLTFTKECSSRGIPYVDGDNR